MRLFFGNLHMKYLLILLTSCLISCTTVNNKVGEALNLDTDLKLNITALHDVNPDEDSQSSPVFVRLYELSSLKSFDNANFIDIYERDAEILGDTMIAKQELKRIVPGTERIERFVLSKETRYVALFAEFYRYKDSTYKAVFPVTNSNVVRNLVKIKVSENSISLID